MRQPPRKRLAAALVLAVTVLRPGLGFAADESYDAVVVGEGPVGLAAAIKIKLAKPDATVALFEKRALDRAPRPNTPTYFRETLDTLSSLGVAVNDRSYTFLKSRVEVAPDGTPTRIELSRPAIEPEHRPYSTGDMLRERGVATTSIGNTEAQLREVATRLGVGLHYESEVNSASNVKDGVELEVGGKDGAHHVHARYAVLADGANGLGSRIAQPVVRGAVPMMAAVSSVKGDGSMRVMKVPEPTAPGGYVMLTKIGSESGVSLLAEVPPRLDAASAEEKQAWFRVQAGRIGVSPGELRAAPSSFPAQLSEGKIGHGRIFVIGDAAGTVPIITGSGVNKGLRQAVDTGSVIGFTLEHPLIGKVVGPALLAIHDYREQAAQHQLIDGIQKSVGDHLRPPPAAVARPATPATPLPRK